MRHLWHPYQSTARANLNPIHVTYAVPPVQLLGPLGQQRTAGFGPILPGRDAQQFIQALLAEVQSKFVGEEESVFVPGVIAPQDIHVLGFDVERLDERAIVWTEAQNIQFREAKATLIRSMSEATRGDTTRALIELNALPTIAPTEAERWIRQTQNLLKAYNDFVVVPSRPEIVKEVVEKKRLGWVIAGSIMFGLLALGGVAWIGTRNSKLKRRRKRR